MLKECKKKLIVMWTPFLRTGIFVINLVGEIPRYNMYDINRHGIN